MTEVEKLHLVEQIGVAMENADPNEANAQNGEDRISIQINSPDNRIAGRDYIEVNIQIGNRPHRGTKNEGKTKSNARRASTIRDAVTEAVNILFPDASGDHVKAPAGP